VASCAETRRGSKEMAAVLAKVRNAVSVRLVRNLLIWLLSLLGPG